MIASVALVIWGLVGVMGIAAGYRWWITRRGWSLRSGDRRMVDFEDLTMRDLADFGSALGLRVNIDAIPFKAPGGTVVLPEAQYETLLRVVGAARSWRVNPEVGTEVLMTALAMLDEVQTPEKET